MKAQLIVKNAAVYSVKMNDEEIHAEAIAVADGKIVYVGHNEGALTLADDKTEIIDAKGASLLPGFGDGHSHVDSCFTKVLPTVSDIVPGPDDTPDTIVDKYKARLKEYVDAHQEKDFIYSIGWDQAYFNGGLKGMVKILSRKDLDEICPNIPLVFISYCGHAMWVNTKALERAGWARTDCPDVPGGIIHREPDGHPTGHITEPAVGNKLVKDGKFFMGEDVYMEAIKLYQDKYGNNIGLTMACDMKSSHIGMRALTSMAKQGKTTIRYSYTYCIEPGNADADYKYALEHVADDQIEDAAYINTLKFFIEGIYSFIDPYRDEWCVDNGYPRGYKGDLIWDTERMYRYMDDGVAHGFNIHIHAMASNSILQAAKLCARCKQAHPDKNVTYTIAHHMCIDDEALKIMADNGIIANLQPYWMFWGNDIANAMPYQHEEPKYGWFPNKTYEDAGVTVAYGSDFPVTKPSDPLVAIGMAMTRTVCPGHKEYPQYKGAVYRTEECVTLKQAIKASTAAVAYQFGWLDFTGTLEEGKSADFVILDGDIEKIDPSKIVTMKVMKTYFKGKKVYEA